MADTSIIKHQNDRPCTVKVVFFDFGGVLAEEGYRDGLLAIARLNGLDEKQFLKVAVELTFERGFVTGKIDEKTFWHILRKHTGIRTSDQELRNLVLSSFTLRPWMVEWVKRVKTSPTRTAILSDQTLWLEELNAIHGFFRWFERVFNSYRIGKSKRDASIFDYVLAEMNVMPHEALFVDDNPGNIQRAKEKEINTIHYQTREGFERELLSFCPSLRGE